PFALPLCRFGLFDVLSFLFAPVLRTGCHSSIDKAPKRASKRRLGCAEEGALYRLRRKSLSAQRLPQRTRDDFADSLRRRGGGWYPRRRSFTFPSECRAAARA